jgi:DNA invertase Pin-like site-specific DNA recombinase
VDTRIVIGATVFTVMAAPVQMGLETRRERITDLATERSATGKDLGRSRPAFTDFQIRNALRLIEAGEPTTQVGHDLGMSRATLTAASENFRSLSRETQIGPVTHLRGHAAIDTNNR